MITLPDLDLTGVPALTLHQPWAHAIAHLGKRVENRCWRPPDHVFRVLIHAGKADKRADMDGWAAVREFGFDINPADVHQSAIVAVADLAGVCDTAINGGPCLCGRWAMPGHYHWLLGMVWPLPRPVPCRGWQRLWYPEPDVLRQVQATGAEVAW